MEFSHCQSHKMEKKKKNFGGIICFKNREQQDKAKREKMTDKFIFYSTLKVSLSSGINSIWRSRFFWKRNWKHFWMQTWKHFWRTSSFVKFLTAVINVPASVLDPTAKQQLCFIFWLFCLKFLQMYQVVVQEFPRRKPADRQPGVTQCNPADCVHPWNQVSKRYVMKEQSCFPSPANLMCGPITQNNVFLHIAQVIICWT